MQGRTGIRRLAKPSRLDHGGHSRRSRFELLEDRRLLDAVPQLVKDINLVGESSRLENLTDVNGTLFFTATDGTTGFELWKSDGTAAGPVQTKVISPRNLTNVNGTLFFTAHDRANGEEL